MEPGEVERDHLNGGYFSFVRSFVICRWIVRIAFFCCSQYMGYYYHYKWYWMCRSRKNNAIQCQCVDFSLSLLIQTKFMCIHWNMNTIQTHTHTHPVADIFCWCSHKFTVSVKWKKARRREKLKPSAKHVKKPKKVVICKYQHLHLCIYSYWAHRAEKADFYKTGKNILINMSITMCKWVCTQPVMILQFYPIFPNDREFTPRIEHQTKKIHFIFFFEKKKMLNWIG